MSLAISTLAHRISIETPLSYDAATDMIEGLLSKGVPWDAIERAPYETIPWLGAMAEAQAVNPYRLPMPRRRIPLREVRRRP